MRSWPGLAAVGAGLIHLGIAAGSSPLVLALLAVTGAAEAGWGVAALRRSPGPRTRVAFAAAVLLVAAWIAVLLVGGGHHHGGTTAGAAADALPVGAVSGAGALDLALAVLLAVALRRGSGAADEQAGPWRFLLGTAAGAGIVAVVAASSLASTAIGAHHVH